MTPEAVRDQLANIASEVDFQSASGDLTEVWSAQGAGQETIEPILQFMESHPTIDYGSPGPLVHFVERFYQHGYEDRLVDSILREPTAHTVWMANRVLNGTKDQGMRSRLVEVMRATVDSPQADPGAKQMAERFLARLAQ